MKRNQLPVDEPARREIRAGEGGNLCVAAGAGSGKTREMVERIVTGLRDGRFTADRIVVITFTRAAAAEMRNRVLEQLKQTLGALKDPAQSKQCRAQLELITSAQITTIHSFCFSLLREKAIEAGIDPFAEPVENPAPLYREAWEKVIALAGQSDAAGTELQRVIAGFIAAGYNLFSQGADDRKISLEQLVCRFLDNRELPLADPQPLDPAVVRSEFGPLFAKYRQLFNGNPKLVDFIGRVETDFNALKLTGLTADQVESALAGLKPRPGNLGGSAGGAKELKEQWNNEWGPLAKRLAYAIGYPVLRQRFAGLRRLLETARAAYTDLLRRRGLIDFTGILIAARDLLKGDPSAREWFKRRYSHYFVDEFQDTDPLQAEIICYLCEAEGKAAAGWETVALAPEKLFVIGDPKQSIYRFRRADIEMFTKVTKMIGKSVSLQTNFRSVPPLLEFINRVFAARITKQGDYQPDYEPLFPPSSLEGEGRGEGYSSFPLPLDGGGQGGGVISPSPTSRERAGVRGGEQQSRVIAVQSDPYEKARFAGDYDHSTKMRAEDLREMEARLVATWLLENKGKLFQQWKEVTILFKNYSILKNLHRVFEEVVGPDQQGIPYTVAGGKNYFARPEINDLLGLLRAINDPTDKCSVVGALRSPLFGFSDQALYDWKTLPGGCGTFNYRALALQDPLPETGVGGALALLLEFHRRRHSIPAADLIFELIHRTELVAGYATAYRGREKVQNLIKAAEYIRALGPVGLTAAIAALADAIKQEYEMGDLDISALVDDAVILMSIHKAKGLQNNIIYLVHGGHREIKEEDLVILDHQLHFGGGKLFKNHDFDTRVAGGEKERAQAEVERLRYVALTRAREYLVINHFPNLEGYRKTKYFTSGIYPDLESPPSPASSLTFPLDGGGQGGSSSFPRKRESSFSDNGERVPSEKPAVEGASSLPLDGGGQGGGGSSSFPRKRESSFSDNGERVPSEKPGVRVELLDPTVLQLQPDRHPFSNLKPKPDKKIESARAEWTKQSAAALARGAVKEFVKINPSRMTGVDLDGAPRIEVSFSDADHRPVLAETKQANIVGTVIHRLLEFGHELKEQELARAAETLAHEHGLTVPVAKLCELYRVVTANEHYRESLQLQIAGTVYRELPIVFTDDAGHLVEGTIDLLYESKQRGGWVLVDYKIITDSGKDKKQIAAEYAAQLQAYKTGLAKVAIDVKHLELASL